ncbi:MAG: type VI secretion system baseplate subunit TssF [Chitinophagaceae bacterium]
MLTEINSSKEVIKNRMLKYALSYWSIKNIEDLDPVVKLMLEALSLELYNLSNEIKDTQVRILEKIAGLLAPDFLTSPTPAHAIVHATPVEPTALLTNTTRFVTQHKISSKGNEVLDTTLDLFFTPVDTVPVFDVQIAYLATGGNLFSYDQSFSKEVSARSGKGMFTETSAIWLGLKINPTLDSIQNLSFYFDWKNLEPGLAQRTYQLLPLTKWYLDEKEIQVAPGIPYAVQPNAADTYETIFLEHDVLSLIENDIKQYYHPKAIYISDTSLHKIQKGKKPYPPSFKGLFSDNELQNLKEALLWVKIVFPATMPQDFLNEVYIYPNAFPVMNRQLNDLKYRLKGGSNIIPLRTGALDQFLSVKSLSDEKHEYRSVPYRKGDEEEVGSYTLRKGGVERFDGRAAREMIGYLIELLRNESAAFAAYGYDFIATTLKEMNQKISLMEQKTRGYIANSVEVPDYIIVKPFEGKDMMYTEYWTTSAAIANNLRAGTKLQQAKGMSVKQDTISFLTTTIGGKNRLRPEERLNAFRYSMMTRNRIITKEDIRNFCFYELKGRIQNVTVERGFEIAALPKEAFRRTIDVMLTPLETDTLDSKEWQVLCEQLQSKLQTRSAITNTYRVLLGKS